MDPNTAKLIHFVGFNAQFEDFMGIAASYRQAYEMTESIHERAFGVRKYSSWGCFRVIRCRKLKQKTPHFLSKV
jgi:hypothetical protein